MPERMIQARRDPAVTAEQLAEQYPHANLIPLPDEPEAAEERIAIILEGMGRL